MSDNGLEFVCKVRKGDLVTEIHMFFTEAYLDREDKEESYYVQMEEFADAAITKLREIQYIL
jgi:hypothetical protein